MPGLKYTKIEITVEAYLALESEAILQSKTLKRLASELILNGVSKEFLDFTKGLAVGQTNESYEEKTARVIKDIGTSAMKFAGNLLETIQKKLLKEGYLETIQYISRNTASKNIKYNL